ncbi:MAG: hypothetical protein QOF61_2220 [Acidobacteriota bacterium]|nr:hypothetical protein [Acidobacteriota bacterium]
MSVLKNTYCFMIDFLIKTFADTTARIKEKILGRFEDIVKVFLKFLLD